MPMTEQLLAVDKGHLARLQEKALFFWSKAFDIHAFDVYNDACSYIHDTIVEESIILIYSLYLF